MLGGALLLSVPLTIWLVWPRTPQLDDPAAGYQAVCPPEPGQPLVVLTYDARTHTPDRGASYTTFYDRFAVFDPSTGELLHREALGDRRDGAPADCFGAAGEHVWLWTQKDGYHVREARTGRVVRTEQQLLGELAASRSAAHFDSTNKQLFVSTKDGRTHVIERSFARTLAPQRRATADRQAPGAPDAREGRTIARDARGKTSRGTLREEGQPRTQLLLDGEPLAGTDWLDPEYVVHLPSRSIEWPDPPSLIVCEPHELGEPHQILTRVALDGRILWTYRRAPESARSGGHTCRWYVTADGTRLVTFVSPNGMVAIDPASGRETYRRAL